MARRSDACTSNPKPPVAVALPVVDDKQGTPSNVTGISTELVIPAGCKRPKLRGARGDEVARARNRRTAERREVELAVERRLDDLETSDVLQVPRLYVVITGSLSSASVLFLIARTSEQAYQRTGSPWVAAPTHYWVHQAGVSQDDWVDARHLLRDLGLIEERSHFDKVRSEIVTEVAFVLEAFSAQVAKVREELRSIAWDSMRTRGGAYLT